MTVFRNPYVRAASGAGLLCLIALLALRIGGYEPRAMSAPSLSFQPAAAGAIDSGVAGNYTNERFGFSLTVPAGYAPREMIDEEGRTTILIQDPKGDGIQILITPFGGDVSELTAEMVQRDIPDMKISEVQPVEIGEGHRGIAFMSDNEAFGGASREVWFVFRGHLYQISTYARLDSLLQAMFGTWRFS